MLCEIHCDQFNQSPILFHPGLNAVIGDSSATNSIGKSSLLMIVDFIFGGDSYITYNTDTVRELGNHEFSFIFKFEQKNFFFKRSTENPNYIRICNESFESQDVIHIRKFTDFLKDQYELNNITSSTFRDLVSRYMRVWGKNNYLIDKPLHGFPTESGNSAILSLISLFRKYDSIAANLVKLEVLESERKSITSAQKNNYLPKINKSQYKENKERLTTVNNAINDIKTNLQNYAINLKQIINEDVLHIKKEKDDLIEKKSNIESQLYRIENNLNKANYIKSKHFESIKELFATINLTKLENIETFHSKMANILKNELLTSKIKLLKQLTPIIQQLQQLDAKLSQMINIENPAIIVDHTFELFSESKRLTLANDTHEKLENINLSIKDTKTKDEESKGKILADISFLINDNMKQLVNTVYYIGHKYPTITFTNSNYTFNIVDDTGTGQAYSNIILFDLAIFKTTNLPALIHDSHLFKNIQNNAVSGFINQYCTQARQSFIAIDEIEKYGKATEATILQNKVVQLSDSMTLFKKDWRSKANPSHN